MVEDAVWRFYLTLWQRAEDAGVGVHYIGFTVQGEDGFFDPHTEPGARRGPELAIVRPYYASEDPLGYKPSKTRSDGQPIDLVAELLTLAHELGHVRSWQLRERTKHFEDALKVFNSRANTGRNPDAEQCRLIKAEEARAWQHAEEELRALNFTDWPRFNDAK